MIWVLVYCAAGFVGAFLGTLAGGLVGRRFERRAPQDWERMMKRWTEPPGPPVQPGD